MNSKFKVVSAGLLTVLLSCIAAAQTTQPQFIDPGELERSFTINAANLSIIPGNETIFLRFSDGVECSSADMSLSTEVLEIDVATNLIATQTQLKLPEMPDEIDRTAGNPGEVIRSMARELKLPEASFNARAIRQVAAAGNVVVQFRDFTLKTEELISTNGGDTWSADGRSVLTAEDAGNHSRYQLEADFLLIDTIDQRALVQGNISGSSVHEGKDPVQFNARQVKFDAESRTLTAEDWLQLSYGSYLITCGRPDPEPAVEVEGPDQKVLVSYNFDSQQLELSGGVVFEDTSDGTWISAGQLSGDLSLPRIEASGTPVLQRGSSRFSGTSIVVWQELGRTIVEVNGEQEAVFNLDEPESRPSEQTSPD